MARRTEKKKRTIKIALVCEKCNNRNYVKSKSKTAQYTLELKKFCKFCRRHTKHKEVKLK
uniref:Large ribosomal subunit protein bL33 n=1 Tax=candidate division CPR3 bacterium TaxID=2268181 RepID=A0A7C5USP5_UNCC3